MASVLKEGSKKEPQMKDFEVVLVCKCCNNIYRQSNNYTNQFTETSIIFGKEVLYLGTYFGAVQQAKKAKCGHCGFTDFAINLIEVI